ncbi:histone acetyltransferase subunit NuA4-domain-containing protein [Tuber borchii]|uniref:Chromatin modification-related protein EAF6 n=1 Tax=Tuber borchii TaxID=42251 RepID=A0A2T7A481_TUBBO|nr:histone acetyltransferase subunit NuA4-domain-containing protein [Tuber borchii]
MSATPAERALVVPAPTAAPATAPAALPAAPDKAGMPYYEKIRKDLRDMIQRKRGLDKTLAVYEENIAKCELTYLEDTQNGNIVKGFDNYIKGTAARRRNNIGDADRIFSHSSLTSAATKLKQQEDNTPVTNSSTPTVAENAPRIGTTVRNKKKRRKGEDESESPSEVETPGPKRVRISFSGQGGA